MATIKDVQNKILEIMKYIDNLCRENDITYFIMGGTALGAVRHGGFIPWDDDLDIFMTPQEYKKFKAAFEVANSDTFVLQEWRTTEQYLEYAKVRMNGTTFIEENFKNRRDLHQGIYVDIMILHKVPNKKRVQKRVYRYSKFVTLVGLSQRNWKPKTRTQKIALFLLKFLPIKAMLKTAYKYIYKFDELDKDYKWCYWITPAGFENGLFDAYLFDEKADIKFEDTYLFGPKRIKEYLKYRYGDYMTLPSPHERQMSIHAIYFSTNKDYKEFYNENRVF